MNQLEKLDTLITINDLSSIDCSQWMPMYLEYAASATTSVNLATRIFERLLRHERGQYAFGAYSHNRLVGFAQGCIHPATRLDSDYCYLQDLFVHADHRGHGIARKLIEHVSSHARANNAIRVYWNTRVNNINAQRLYDKVAIKADDVLQYRINLTP